MLKREELTMILSGGVVQRGRHDDRKEEMDESERGEVG